MSVLATILGEKARVFIKKHYNKHKKITHKSDFFIASYFVHL